MMYLRFKGNGPVTARRRQPARKEPGEIQMINCPKCDAVIDVEEEELDEGDSLTCEECGANLNVTGVSPLELTSADEEEEDEEELDDFDKDEEDEDAEVEEEDEEDWR